MILVAASPAEQPAVREFFELFKTPWEFYRDPQQSGDVLLCTSPSPPRSGARLVLIFNAGPDGANGGTVLDGLPRMLVHGGDRFPVYGNCVGFDQHPAPLRDEVSGTAATRETHDDGRTIVRIGYDLFSEIRHLLTLGQPEEFASCPTLEAHVAVLRKLILDHGLPVVEVPPIPVGYKFIACLTHDFDHVGIRNHLCDHTILGFLYRATIGSSLDTFRGRKTLRQLGRNCRAAFSLPFVHLGLAPDPWYAFKPYVDLENGLPSTFFLIPKRGHPGQDRNGRCQPKRAARYDVRKLSSHVDLVLREGKEVGVHGIDAWRDAVQGRIERDRITEMTGTTELGVRMHWLYFDQKTPEILEQAGFSYDSTVGYNGTIGFRAGTTQAYRPLTTERLLELPMHLMDTAMFYPSYLNLSPKEGEATALDLIQKFCRHGGAMTINWHDRSIVPERLWDSTYVFLLDQLKSAGAWFATASQAVSWFRRRRAVRFAPDADGAGTFQVSKAGFEVDSLSPQMLLRVHHPDPSGKHHYVDSPLPDGRQVCLAN